MTSCLKERYKITPSQIGIMNSIFIFIINHQFLKIKNKKTTTNIVFDTIIFVETKNYEHSSENLTQLDKDLIQSDYIDDLRYNFLN